MGFWQITYNGVTKDCAAWGVSKPKRKRKSAATDAVAFSLDGFPVDGNPPFAQWQNVTILRNGVQWFVGVVTKIPRKGSGRSESIDYEISGPWYWLEKTVFQQIWTSFSGGGEQISSAQSSVILGQSLEGLKLVTGQVILEVLLYTQYAFQGQPYPNTTLTAEQSGLPASYWPSNIPLTFLIGLPPPPNPANGPLPFLIGQIDPNIAVSYSQVRDKSCADIVRLSMKYTPDAVAWVDYTTTPPTINVTRRQGMPAKTIAVVGGNSGVVAGFDPTPRYDLQVPAVLIKYSTTQSLNGKQLSILIVDQHPSNVPDNTPRNWISTVDLVGSKTTTQTSSVVTQNRPISSGDSSVMNWIFKKEPWLKANPMGNTASYLYDWNNVGCAFLSTRLDDNDPLRTSNPNDITIVSAVGGSAPDAPGDCPQLVNELLSSFPGWMQEVEQLDSAKVVVEVWLKYSGSDAATKGLFWFDPSNPTVPKTDGTGFLIRYYPIKATNASTEDYTRITSFQAGEPTPVGVAQYLYECMAPLHWEGTLTTVEQECSDQLPIGFVFNTTDGNSLWQSMDALVLEVEEETETGTTIITFGPPLFLGLQEIEELFRSNEGVRPSFQLSQRTDGMTASGAEVTDAKHAGNDGVSAPPGGSPSTPDDFPFSISVRTNPGDPTGNTFQALVNLDSNLYRTPNVYDNVAFTGLNTWFNLNANDTIWMLGEVSGGAITGNPTIHSFGQGNSDYIPGAAPWSTGGIVENDGATPPNQTLFRKVIAVFVADINGHPSLSNQLISTNQVMKATALNGLAATYPGSFS